MKLIKIKKTFLFALVFLTAMQPVTAVCMENSEKSWWQKNVFSTISSLYSTITKSIKDHPYVTATGIIALLFATKKLYDAQQEKITSEKNDSTPSLIHLMLAIPSNHYRQIEIKPNIALIPQEENNNIWLWNNGQLSTDKMTYTTTYNGKTYISTYDSLYKCWDTTEENKMGYLTYYNYCRENNKDTQTFTNHLTNKAFDLANQSKIILKKNNERYKTIKESLMLALEKEEKLVKKGKNVFYHSYNSSLDTFYTFVTLLHNYLDINDGVQERSPYEELQRYETVDDFILKKMQDSNDSKQSAYLMAAHMGLFGGINDSGGECTVYFFANNFSYITQDKKPKTIITSLKKLSENIGLKFEEKSIKDLYKEYSKIGGKLKQISIKPQYTNKIAYVSAPFGYPLKYPHLLKNNSIIQEYAPKLKKMIEKTDIKISNHPLDTTNLLTLLLNYTSCLKSDSNHLLDRVQIRLLHFSKPFFNQEEAKKYGLKIRYYYSKENAKGTEEELRKRMDNIVKDMLWEALENKTLKETAQKTKLYQLYKAGKITQKDDLDLDNLKKLATSVSFTS